MARIAYYTRDKILDILMKILYRADGSRRSYRDMAENAQLLKVTRWSKDSKSHLGSFSRMLEALKISEMTLFEEAKSRMIISQHLDFSEFSNNKKLNYEKPTEDSTISKAIPKARRLKELCFRLGVTESEVDVSVMTEDEVYEFLKAIGFTQLEIDNTLLDIEKIKYLGR